MNPRTEAVAIGIDVGSTTVKAVVVDPETKEILWSDYQRHQTKQAELVLEFLERIARRVPEHPTARRSASSSPARARRRSAPHIGGEVRAGGQRGHARRRDAAPRRRLGRRARRAGREDHHLQEERGDRRQDRHHLDERQVRVGHRRHHRQVLHQGRPAERGGRQDRASTTRKLHHVAAKCGVFAETDIVNLVKSGIPSTEIMCSLADAIVMQNLSVLTRGNTLRHKVLLLGGPEHLPAVLAGLLAQAHPRDLGRARLRLPEGRADRGADHRPRERAVLRGVRRGDVRPHEAADGRRLHGHRRRSTTSSRNGRARRASARPRARRSSRTMARARRVPRALHDPEVRRRRRSSPGRKVRARHRHGRRLDVVEGRARSTTRRASILKKAYQLSKGNPIAGHQGDPGAAQDVRHRPGRDARGHGLRRHRLRGRRARGVGEVAT